MSNQQNLFGVADHSNLGKKWEADLEATHDWYRMQRLVDVRKIPSNWEFISENEYKSYLGKRYPGTLAVCDNARKMQRVKSDVDYVGGGSSFSIVFEAKTSAGTNFPLANIEPHQLEKLRQRDRCGILAGAMVMMAKYERAFFVPFKYLDKRNEILLKQTGRRAAPGTASISLSDFESYATEIFKHKNNRLWDWLPQLVK